MESFSPGDILQNTEQKISDTNKENTIYIGRTDL